MFADEKVDLKLTLPHADRCATDYYPHWDPRVVSALFVIVSLQVVVETWYFR